MTRHKDELLFKFPLVTLVVILGANLGTMLYYILLITQSIPMAEVEPLMAQGFDTERWGIWFLFFGNIFPYVIPTVLIFAYQRPIYRWLKAEKRKSSVLPTQQILRRVQNVPLVSSLMGSSGWILAYVSMLILFALVRPQIDETYRHWAVFALIQLFAASVLTFVISFFTMEYINRRWFIPRFFPQGDLTGVSGVIRISIKARFMLLGFATSFYPLVFIGGGLLLQGHAQGVNPVVFFIISFLPICGILFLLVSKFFQKPLVEMEKATQEIRQENYTVKVQVTSSDELGHLGEGLNSMAQGLQEKVMIKDTFGKMVDPAVRDHLLSGNLDLGGKLTPAAILFADLRDFTPMTESLAPDLVVRILNRFFAQMNQAIAAEGGLVNKYLGDAVMALFNVPLAQEDFALRAFRACLAMEKALVQLNQELSQEKLPTLRMGIALHSGPVLAGNIGSAQRMEYTVIGDPVNAASRLESLNKTYNTNFLISGDFKAQLGSFTGGRTFRSLERASVKGKSQDIEVWAVE